MGRFLNADGYVTTGSVAPAANMFAYCLNNPIMYSDDGGNCYYNALGEWTHPNWELPETHRPAPAQLLGESNGRKVYITSYNRTPDELGLPDNSLLIIDNRDLIDKKTKNQIIALEFMNHMNYLVLKRNVL